MLANFLPKPPWNRRVLPGVEDISAVVVWAGALALAACDTQASACWVHTTASGGG